MIIALLILSFLGCVYLLYDKNNDLQNRLTEIEQRFIQVSNNFTEADFNNRTLKVDLEKLAYDNENLKLNWQAELLRNNEILSQKKSSEVRVGAITENLIPIIQGLPYDSTNLKHLGQPLDYVYFDYTGAEGVEIVFIEVKSGKAKESKRQKLLKNAIKLGKVYYEELRVDEDGIKIKRAVNGD